MNAYIQGRLVVVTSVEFTMRSKTTCNKQIIVYCTNNVDNQVQSLSFVGFTFYSDRYAWSSLEHYLTTYEASDIVTANWAVESSLGQVKHTIGPFIVDL